MTIGFAIIGHDNDSYMFETNDNIERCCKCGLVLNSNYINPKLVIKKRNLDFSYTYDNRCIVSKRFKDFCEKNDYTGTKFELLPNDSSFFVLNISNLLEVDKERKKFRSEKFCDSCNTYGTIVPGFPVILKTSQKLEDGFYATDTETGNGNSRSKIYIIGVETYKKIIKEKFKGILFKDIVN